MIEIFTAGGQPEQEFWPVPDEPMQWRGGCSVHFAVGGPGVHIPSRVIPKHFKNGILSLLCLALITKGIVWRTSWQARLLCPSERHLTGCLGLYVADRWQGQKQSTRRSGPV